MIIRRILTNFGRVGRFCYKGLSRLLVSVESVKIVIVFFEGSTGAFIPLGFVIVVIFGGVKRVFLLGLSNVVNITLFKRFFMIFNPFRGFSNFGS